MSRNIVEFHFSRPPEGNNITYYFVMTGLAGYVNADTGIILRPSAQLFSTLTDRWGSTVCRCAWWGTCGRTRIFSLHMVHGMG